MSSQDICTHAGQSNHTRLDWGGYGTTGYVAAGFLIMLFVIFLVFAVRYLYALWRGHRKQHKDDMKAAMHTNPDSLNTPLQNLESDEEDTNGNIDEDTAVFLTVDKLPTKKSDADLQMRTSSA